MCVQPEAIGFRPLAESDMVLMHRWLNNPEVARWYGLAFENRTYPTLDEVRQHYAPNIRGEEPTHCYVIVSARELVGHIQSYRIGDHPGYARALDFDENAFGIDLFIGEDSARGGGMGCAVLRRFLEDEVFARVGAETALIAPNPENLRAVRCYEKAGFRHVKTVWVPEENGHEYVMALHRERNRA